MSCQAFGNLQRSWALFIMFRYRSYNRTLKHAQWRGV